MFEQPGQEQVLDRTDRDRGLDGYSDNGNLAVPVYFKKTLRFPVVVEGTCKCLGDYRIPRSSHR